MARTNIDIDEEACAKVMKRFSLKTKRDAVNFALRRLANEVKPMTPDEIRAFMDTDWWEGDLDEMRRWAPPQ
jgi:Arc/MetJ family transcription regulator